MVLLSYTDIACQQQSTSVIGSLRTERLRGAVVLGSTAMLLRPVWDKDRQTGRQAVRE